MDDATKIPTSDTWTLTPEDAKVIDSIAARTIALEWMVEQVVKLRTQLVADETAFWRAAAEHYGLDLKRYVYWAEPDQAQTRIRVGKKQSSSQ